MLHSAGLSGAPRPGEDRFGRHGGQVRQQRVEQQEAETPDDLHQRAAGGAGEGLPEDALSRCVREGTAGHEDGINRGQSAGISQSITGHLLSSHYCLQRKQRNKDKSLRIHVPHKYDINILCLLVDKKKSILI